MRKDTPVFLGDCLHRIETILPIDTWTYTKELKPASIYCRASPNFADFPDNFYESLTFEVSMVCVGWCGIRAGEANTETLVKRPCGVLLT